MKILKQIKSSWLKILKVLCPPAFAYLEKKKRQKIYKKKVEELRRRDPFIYKNH